MKSRYFLLIAPILFSSITPSRLYADKSSVQTYDSRPVSKISVQLENQRPNQRFDSHSITTRLRTKVGDPFSQIAFDQDLKMLSETYDRVEPEISLRNGEITISIRLWEKPIIRSISWEGNDKISSKTLKSELGIKPYTVFNHDEFNKAFTKVKEYYIKKGFYDSRLSYRVLPVAGTSEVDILVTVEEGHAGRIRNIEFSGFTPEEEVAVLEIINTKRYNVFLSWLTGQGTYQSEIIERDKMLVTHYLQNEGYADASVDITVSYTQSKEIKISISAEKGEKYTFDQISFSGNALYSDFEIQEILPIKAGATYSPDKLRSSTEMIRDLYGKKGFIDTDVRYVVFPNAGSATYNVLFEISEGEEYRIGLVRIIGNTKTQPNVILRESHLLPGELFDSRKLKATQDRLMAMGYFKNVNVYPVRTSADTALGENYRDVVIEVEETTTGNVGLFFGLSSSDSLNGGLDFAENNFDIDGLGKFWREGLSSLRGAGEYAHIKLQFGIQQQEYTLAWMTPYLHDTLWRFGTDLTYSRSVFGDKDYTVKAFGGNISASYPLNQYWTYGMILRGRNAIIDVNSQAGEVAAEQERNSGLVIGYNNYISFDSTDHPFKPHRGFRSSLSGEIAGLRRHDTPDRYFPFAKLGYINSYYYPIWRKGTLKFRSDFKFCFPFGDGNADLLPVSERFFLGGDATMRGFRPQMVGPKFVDLPKGQPIPERQTTYHSNDANAAPSGGVTSIYLSLEYNQELHKALDGFLFFDAGTISMTTFGIERMYFSTGLGARISLGNRLPITVGFGYPINPDSKHDRQYFFFAMGGQF